MGRQGMESQMKKNVYLPLIIAVLFLFVIYASGRRQVPEWQAALIQVDRALALYRECNFYNFPAVDAIVDLKTSHPIDWKYVMEQIGTPVYLGHGLHWDKLNPDRIFFWSRKNNFIYFLHKHGNLRESRFNFAKGELPYTGSNRELERHALARRIQQINLEKNAAQSSDLLSKSLMLNDYNTSIELIKHGIGIFHIDDNNITPLMRAISNDFDDISFRLIEQNANLNVINIFGDSARDIAYKRNNMKIDRKLRK